MTNHTYDNNSRIATLQEAKAFIRHVVFDLGWIEFHPDDSFASFRRFPSDKVSLYDRLKAESFEACRAAGADIYQIGITEVRNYMVKHKIK